MKFRKIMALALCLCMLLSICMVQAEESCAHENTSTEELWYYCVFKPFDNAEHEVSGLRIRVTTCDDCGTTTNEEALGEKTETAPHDYDSEGVCVDCGHVKTCAHENIGNTDDFLKNAVYTPIDASTHEGTGELWREVFCRDCDMWVTIGMIAEEGTLIERHYFEDGVCYECGYESNCAHENTHTEGGWWDSVYEPVDNQYHIHSGYYADDLRCSDCGEWLEYGDSEYRTREENHWYNENGVCGDCGHVNTCVHEDTSIDNYFQNEQYEALDAEYHQVSGELWQMTYCYDCGMYTSEELISSEATDTERHYYENGFCWLCGYVNTCVHDDVRVTTEFAYDEATVKLLNDSVHEATGPIYERTTCRDCNEDFVKLLETATIEAKHVYYGDECEWCGHKNVCAHVNVEESRYNEGEIVYEAIDDFLHRVIYTDSRKLTTCLDCGYRVFEEGLGEYSKEDTHYYMDGKCVFCDHVSSCKHENTETKEMEFLPAYCAYEQIDEWTHRVTGERWVRTYCKDCNALLLAETSDGHTAVEDHAYLAAWEVTCWRCGYIRREIAERPTAEPTATPTVAPTAEPTAEPTAAPTAEPTAAPTAEPTAAPTAEPTVVPTAEPTATPTVAPTAEPTAAPTAEPTAVPTVEPTAAPTAEPTVVPTAEPTAAPTAEPSAAPTAEPTAAPTVEPTATPDPNRTELNTTGWSTGDSVNVRTEPNTNCSTLGQVHYGDELQVIAAVKNEDGVTWYEVNYNGKAAYIRGDLVTLDGKPGTKPTAAPTAAPTAVPTAEPTAVPTAEPTAVPTAEPTAVPTAEPTAVPTAEPTVEPTIAPVVKETVIEQLVIEKKPMVETMMIILDEIEAAAEETGVNTTIQIANVEKVISKEEKEVLDTLPVKEQMLIVLAAIGHKEAVETMLGDEENGMTLSDEAQTMMTAVTERLEKMTEEEKTAFEEMLLMSFPVEEIELEDGTKLQYFVIELIITTEEETHVERYGFRYDETVETWIFMQIDTAANDL